MFANKFTAIATALIAASAAVSAAPGIVFDPPITAPTAGQIWTIGSTQTVTWDTTNIPEGSLNQTGLILLGFIEDGSDDEHLDTRMC